MHIYCTQPKDIQQVMQNSVSPFWGSKDSRKTHESIEKDWCFM